MAALASEMIRPISHAENSGQRCEQIRYFVGSALGELSAQSASWPHCTKYRGHQSCRSYNHQKVQRTEDGLSERRLSSAATNSADTKQDCKTAPQHDPRTHCVLIQGDQ